MSVRVARHPWDGGNCLYRGQALNEGMIRRWKKLQQILTYSFDHQEASEAIEWLLVWTIHGSTNTLHRDRRCRCCRLPLRHFIPGPRHMQEAWLSLVSCLGEYVRFSTEVFVKFRRDLSFVSLTHIAVAFLDCSMLPDYLTGRQVILQGAGNYTAAGAVYGSGAH